MAAHQSAQNNLCLCYLLISFRNLFLRFRLILSTFSKFPKSQRVCLAMSPVMAGFSPAILFHPAVLPTKSPSRILRKTKGPGDTSVKDYCKHFTFGKGQNDSIRHPEPFTSEKPSSVAVQLHCLSPFWKVHREQGTWSQGARGGTTMGSVQPLKLLLGLQVLTEIPQGFRIELL